MSISKASISQEKTIIGLTNTEISRLQKANPDVKFNLDNYNGAVPQYFNSVAEAQSYIDSVRNVILNLNTVPEQLIQLSSGTGKYAECGCGDYYAAYAGSAGMFSSFNMSFSYCNGGVSNASIGVNGFQIGWSLGSTASTYNGLYGCSAATATFVYWALSWTQTIHINWHFNPNICTYYYSLGNGPCGATIAN